MSVRTAGRIIQDRRGHLAAGEAGRDRAGATPEARIALVGGSMSMLTLRQAPPGRPARQFDWPSPASIPRLWLTVAFAGCSYLLAAMAVLVWKSRGLDAALVISLVGALAAPMWLMAADHVQQPEVRVIDQSATMLLHRGTPYPGPAMLAATHNPNVFDPYLPALTAFGIPRVLLGFSSFADH